MRLSLAAAALALIPCAAACVSPAPPRQAPSISPSPSAARRADPAKVRIRVSFDPRLSPAPTSGRLFVLMSGAKKPADHLALDFSPFGPWIAAREIAHIDPGATITMDPDELAFPEPFSRADPGVYQWMALLDVDHSFPYTHESDGDLFGPVAREEVHKDGLSEISLVIDRRDEKKADPPSPSRKSFEIPSALLSAFWGRPMALRAVVALPPGYDDEPQKRYPGVYIIHGFGGSAARNAARDATRLQEAMGAGKIGKQILIFLDGTIPSGHHEFADSVNNGPWGRALTEELIPALEKSYRLLADPRARLLSGHSSGGWSSLWLQITYPDFFGGTWSTSPDPVDFRNFCGVNLTPSSRENYLVNAAGKPRNLFRMGDKEVMSMGQFVALEEVEGGVGGQIASFEWVFSPRGPDGSPQRIFDRATGAIDPAVAATWQRYDIRRTLEDRWPVLGPKLRGKIHIFVGGADSFHLEESVKLLCDFLVQKGSNASCEIIPDRHHFNLYEKHPSYPDGLFQRILAETLESANRVSVRGAP